jgi:TonB-dependent receptor
MRRRAFDSLGSAFIGSTCLIALPGLAAAQNADNNNNNTLEEVVVTGIRASLQSSTEAKKEATGFSDSIFAEDIGKFPDSNIAESFNRIPGITIARDISGEGVNIAIRGLGQNFTRVLLNNAPVAVASTGRTDAQSTNREVDLDMFPTELFTQLTVRKSSAANMPEGGAAGTVNMRSARPFDNPGQHLTFAVQGSDNDKADAWGGRGSILANKSWDTFGVLVGVAGVRNKVDVPGYETVGWTNPNLTVVGTNVTAAQAQCTGTCNGTGGGNWTIPGTVPANAGNGLTQGDVINQAFLLAHNPGLTIQQIDNAIIPRLSRPVADFGNKDRYNGIVSFEFRPSDALHFYVDSMYGKKSNDLQRIDMNWVGRNGAIIPLNMQVDRADCTTGCVVTNATYANAQFFLEYRPYIEDTEFWGANPGLTWQMNDTMTLDFNANKTHSWFHRESPSVLAITPGSSGVTVNYVNDGGLPSVTSNVDLNNPANFNWPGARVNIQDERRVTETKGARTDFTWSKLSAANVHIGAAYDDVMRRIRGFDNSQAWQNAACGDNPSVFLPGPNTQPACDGLVNTNTATLPGNYPRYPAFGTGFSAGQTPPVTYAGSLIPATQFQSYLTPGPAGFITLDWNRFKKDANYAAFHDSAPESGGTNTGASGGLVREKTTGAYFSLSGETDLDGNRLRYTAGIRRVKTEQTIGGQVSISDPRNAVVTNPATNPPLTRGNDPAFDGSRFPNIVNFVEIGHTYYNTLPSFEVAYNLSEKAIVRAAASRTMTRPDPNAQLPGLNFSSPSADTGSVGNPALDPFISENLDFGLEYYTGKEGYAGIAAFRKRVKGFTVNGITTVPFSALAVYGVTFDTLTPTQQTNINARGGPDAAFVNLTQQVNASGALTVNGLELNWVQPLDFLLGRVGLDGFGFSANLTLINQSGKGAAPAIAVGVSPHTYNATFYYENHGISARLAGTFTKGSQASGLNQNGIPLAAFFADDYEQWDFSSSVDLSHFFNWDTKFELTLDGINLFDQKQRTDFQFSNSAQTIYNPGRQWLVGVRGRF